MGKNGHCVIPLMGRFKQETGKRNLIIVLANVTSGGLEIRKWVELLVRLLESEGRGVEVGPVLCNENGYMIERWRLNGELHSILAVVQEMNLDVIPSETEVDNRFNVYRSFRRGATTRAKERKG